MALIRHHRGRCQCRPQVTLSGKRVVDSSIPCMNPGKDSVMVNGERVMLCGVHLKQLSGGKTVRVDLADGSVVNAGWSER